MSTLRELHDIAVKMGVKHDPRQKNMIERQLKDAKDKFKKLSNEKKEYFDRETLTNPYSDSRILNGTGKETVKTLACGVDIESPELLLIDRLRRNGQQIDAVMAHHPTGRALASLNKVMDIQVDVFREYGVPENITEKLMGERSKEVMRAVNPVNAHRALDAAGLLNIPYFNAHTPTDNIGYYFVKKLIEKNEKKLYLLEDLEELLLTIPEIKIAKKMGYGPVYFLGSNKSRCGKVAVTEFTGGTGGPKTLYEKLSQAGVGTIVSMHIGDINRKEAKKYNLNVIVAGHMASDSIGINLLLDQFEKKGVSIVPMSGFIRFSRGPGNNSKKNK